jgi:hypothetical protein
MGVFEFTARISFASESADAVRVPKVLGIDRVLIARSKDDLENGNYEVNYSITWSLLNLSGQALDPELYTLQRGNSFSIDRKARVTIGHDDKGNAYLASSRTHYLMLFLGMPLFFKQGDNADRIPALYAIKTPQIKQSPG